MAAAGMGVVLRSGLGLDAGQQAAGSTSAASQSWGTGTALRQEEKAGEGAGWESESLPGHPCLAKEMPVH